MKKIFINIKEPSSLKDLRDSVMNALEWLVSDINRNQEAISTAGLATTEELNKAIEELARKIKPDEPAFHRHTQATLPATAKVGYVAWVTDYDHLLYYGTAGWTWGPGDTRNAGEIAFFDSNPGTGWKAVDGTGDDGQPIGASHPIVILKSDGTTRNITTLAALTGYLKGGAFNGTQNTATIPTISQPTFTGNTAIFTGGSDTTGSGAASIGANNASNTFQIGTGASNTVASNGHVHTDAGHTHNFTPTGTVSTPSGTVSQPTATLPADPIPNMTALPYIRK